MTTFKWFASLVLAATIVPALAAKTHCPGNAASVPPLGMQEIVFCVQLAPFQIWR
jgi:hypothetical protein